jgi:cytolysin (calcineurin-like family phosphatase)
MLFGWRGLFRRNLALLACVLVPLAAAVAAPGDEVTFYLVSDTHYGQSPRGDETLPLMVEKMNGLPGTPYPEALGGAVGIPRGVIHAGDVTNDGKATNWLHFVQDYGLDGTDGGLKFPVYETFGNHDGGPASPVREAIRQRNLLRVGVTNVSENGMHYSWDWGPLHLVNLGISPGTTRQPYDPQDSSAFAAADLARRVGDSGRPVILIHHFGFDREHSWSWWPDEWKTQYDEMTKGYNVVAILHGHMHRPAIYRWEGRDVYHPPHFRQDVKADGPVEHGFFVFRITDRELAVAERKLDDTWGMTARKDLRQPVGERAAATEESAR